MSKYMEPLHTVVYDGVPLSDFGVYTSGAAAFSAADRDYEVVEVPGRSGDLLFDNKKYKNISVTYRGFIVENFKNNIDGLRNYLSSNFGYRRIEDTYNPEYYRLGFLANSLVVETANLDEAGGFDIVFNCKPQRFLKSGEVELEFNQNGGISNPTYNTAKPLIRVYGHGTFAISTYEVTVLENQHPYVDIDCELQEAFCETLNCNSYISVTTDFPELKPGYSGIVIGSGISKIVITPRWWSL